MKFFTLRLRTNNFTLNLNFFLHIFSFRYLKDIGSGKKLKKGAGRGEEGDGGDPVDELDMDKNKTALLFAGKAAAMLCTCTYTYTCMFTML